MEKLVDAGVRVIFVTEGIDTEKDDYRLYISVHESCAQAENESRSENIKWGNKQRAANGTSKLYDRKCYGYTHDDEGKLIIVEEEAKVVKMIFDWYLQGDSVIAIIKKLEQQGIKTSTGKTNGLKRRLAICSVMISTQGMLSFSKKDFIANTMCQRKITPPSFRRKPLKQCKLKKVAGVM